VTTENQELIPLPAPDAVPPHQHAELYQEEGYALVYEDLSDFGEMLSLDWAVTSEDDADAVMARLTAYKEELARREAAFQAKKRELESKISWLTRRYMPNLQAFAARQLAGKKAETVNLPCGAKLYFRKVPAAIEVTDEQAYQNWVSNHLPEAVSFEPKYDKRMVNKYVEKLPKMPPGLAVRPAEKRFYIG
jgi:hypothetical protein